MLVRSVKVKGTRGVKGVTREVKRDLTLNYFSEFKISKPYQRNFPTGRTPSAENLKLTNFFILSRQTVPVSVFNRSGN